MTTVQQPSPPPPTRAAAARAARSTSARIVSLDFVRGVMLIASVGVNSLLETPPWFDHAKWASTHPIDIIFPIFVTLSGCGLAFAMHKRVKIWPLVRRIAVLLIAGLLYNAVVSNVWDFETWRLTGVLQLYAFVVLFMGLLHFVTRSWKGWAVITVSLALTQAVVLATTASTCFAGVLSRACNPSGVIDPLLFGPDHIYQLGLAGHDPEGLVASFGALVSASAGATVGHLLLSLRRRSPQVVRVGTAILPLLGVAAAFVALALVLSLAPSWFGGEPLPIMKRLWTGPFALLIAAGTTVALLLAHLLVDRPGTGKVLGAISYPLLALGRNSLLVYFGSHALMSILSRPIDDGPSIAQRIADTIAIAGHPQLGWTILVLLFWIGLSSLLHRHKIYLRP